MNKKIANKKIKQHRDQSLDDGSSVPKIGHARHSKLIDASFSVIYLTLLSIIQSAALSFLVIEVTERVKHFDLFNTIMLINTFITLVIVWHYYLEGLLL